MYKVVTTHESQTNKAEHDLSSTGMTAASSVRRPMNRDSHVKNSVLANSKKPAKKVAVYVRKNKQTDITSENVISKKENVIDVDVVNAPKAKTLLCVSFRKTRFSKESTLSKSLDTTYVVSKPKIDVRSTSKANDKVVQIVLGIVDSCCSKHMTGDRSLLKNFIKKFMGTVRFGNDNFAAITGYGDYIQEISLFCRVYLLKKFKKIFVHAINSAAQPTQIHEDSPSTSLIIVDEHEAPPIVTTSDEQTSPISLTEADEFNQEDSADFDGNSQFVSYNPPSHEEIESSTMALEPSNVQNFHQVQPSTHI
ncbi:hypothetical protein Tco_1325389 [Tanacetum coccineum]